VSTVKLLVIEQAAEVSEKIGQLKRDNPDMAMSVPRHFALCASRQPVQIAHNQPV
jgi:hypothetical protein